MKFAHVENNSITELASDNAKNTKRTSNFYLLSSSEKKSLGWENIVDHRPNFKEYEDIDSIDVQLVDNIPTRVYGKKTMSLADYKEFKRKQINYYEDVGTVDREAIEAAIEAATSLEQIEKVFD